jgi:hypothetical protein
MGFENLPIIIHFCHVGFHVIFSSIAIGLNSDPKPLWRKTKRRMLDLDDLGFGALALKASARKPWSERLLCVFAIQCDSGLLHSPLVSCFAFELLLYVLSHRSSIFFPVA